MLRACASGLRSRGTGETKSCELELFSCHVFKASLVTACSGLCWLKLDSVFLQCFWGKSRVSALKIKKKIQVMITSGLNPDTDRGADSDRASGSVLHPYAVHVF